MMFVKPAIGLLEIAIWFQVCCVCCAERPNTDRPNIVHIIADDLGWNDVGFHGSEIKTPALDQLASESVLLERFYVTPICSPTRAGVLTGRYPFRFGIWNGVCSPVTRHGLPPAEITTPELLKAAGYEQCAILGKWHLGLASTKFHPLRHGFTDFYGHYNGAIDYFSRMRFGELDWHRNYESIDEEGYSTDLLGEAAVELIKRQSTNSPFYLLVAFNAPHSPIQAKASDLERYGFDKDGDRAPNTDAGISKREKFPEYGEAGKGNSVRQTFAAMTTAMDRNVGKILAALEEGSLANNTLVIFHSDNGGDPKHGGSNHPLRGNKFTTWEGGVRVPAMIRWPAQLQGGRKVSAVTSYIDLLPTQLAAADRPIPANVDGINLLPMLQAGKGEKGGPDRMILLNKNTIVSNRWKLKDGKVYDLHDDPSEMKESANAPAAIVEALTMRLAEFSTMVGPKSSTSLPRPERWPPPQWKLPEESEH